MATPPLAVHLQEVGSTQDEARSRFVSEPLLVTASSQRDGRGRNDAKWRNADRAVAASLAFVPTWWVEEWPRLTLVAGLAALDILPKSFGLKWPNDLVIGDDKVGGILTEADDDLVVVGLGLNIFWEDPPAGMVGAHSIDPGPGHGQRIAERWAVALLERASADPTEWGQAEYVERCVTIGRDVRWQPGGAGRAVGVSLAGGLLVETDGEVTELVSGAVHEVRPD